MLIDNEVAAPQCTLNAAFVEFVSVYVRIVVEDVCKVIAQIQKEQATPASRNV